MKIEQVRLADIAPGEYYRKTGGTYIYLRLDPASVERWCPVLDGRIVGIGPHGQISYETDLSRQVFRIPRHAVLRSDPEYDQPAALYQEDLRKYIHRTFVYGVILNSIALAIMLTILLLRVATGH